MIELRGSRQAAALVAILLIVLVIGSSAPVLAQARTFTTGPYSLPNLTGSDFSTERPAIGRPLNGVFDEDCATPSTFPMLLAQQGCCSSHGGVCGCSGGRTQCCDGKPSPSCTCSSPPSPPTLPPPPALGCLTYPLSATPSSPVVTELGFSSADRMRVEVWRQHCQNGTGSFPVMRVTPLTIAPFLCTGTFSVRQGGKVFDNIHLTLQPEDSISAFCGDLIASATFALSSWSHEPPFYDPDQAFTLRFDGSGTHSELEVPSTPPPSPPTLPPTSPPTLIVHAIGCTTCHGTCQ